MASVRFATPQSSIAVVVSTILLIITLLAHAQEFVDVRRTFVFGSNEFGQLGVTNPETLNEVKFQTPLKLFCSRAHYAVSVDHENVIRTWGRNDGQLGFSPGSAPHQNTFIDSPSIVALPSVTPAPNFTSISCGDEHTLLLDSQFRVFGFGKNNMGQLGSNATATTAPIHVESLQAFKFHKIYAFNSFSFAIDENNDLYGFGANNFGQLGVPNPSQGQNFRTTPVKVMENVDHVAGGSSFTLIVTRDRKFFSTGLNLHGQLGINDASRVVVEEPVQSNFFQNIDIAKAFARESTGLVLTSNDEFFFFGRNNDGVLGIPATSTSVIVPTKLNLTFSGRIQQISIGAEHSLILTDAGKVYATGKNDKLQLGPIHSNASPTSTVTAFEESPLLSNTTLTGTVHSVHSGFEVSYLFTTEGKLFSIGTMLRLGVPAYLAVPQELDTPVDFNKVYAGRELSFSIETDSGRVWSWGRNILQVVRPNSTRDQYIPAIFETLEHNITQIGISSDVRGGSRLYTVYAVRNTSKDVYGWGDNSNGQLALGTTDIAAINFPIRLDVTNETTVERIIPGARHVLLIGRRSAAPSGPIPRNQIFDLFGWGANLEGQLGLFSLDFRPTRQIIESEVGIVGAGDYYTIYVGQSGILNVAGENNRGQIGMGPVGQISAFTDQETLTLNRTSNFTVLTIYGGSESTFIVTNEGVYVTGDNTFGTLGINSTQQHITVPVLNPFLSNVRDILKIESGKGGGKHTLVLMRNGDVFGFGRNDKGQLGLGDFRNRLYPVKISLPDVALDIAAGTDHSMVVIGSKRCPNDCYFPRGVCDRVTGTCQCDESLFTGFDCSLFKCSDPLCGGHGTCDFEYGECICDREYTGETCTSRRCENNCSGRGSCDGRIGQCNCDEGWGGIDCSRSATGDAPPSTAPSSPLIQMIIFVTAVLISYLLV